jgi:uncharacterized protein (DUF433 family)
MATAASFRHIASIPGVRSGHPIIAGTRVAVHDVIGLTLTGENVEGVVRCFPNVSRAQVYECLAYYEENQGEMDALVARQMEEAR